MKPQINTDKHGNSFSPKNLLCLSVFICGSFFFLCGCIKGPDFPYMLSPRAIVQTPTNPSSANIAISFQLIDREKELGNIILQYSTNGGASFNSATLVDSSETQNLQSDWYPGIIHTVRWNSVTDMVGISRNASVIVKVTPSDATNPSGGTSDVSRTFTVNNIEFNQPPSVSITTPSGVQLGNIPINYSLSDVESDTCSIMVEYSTDGGGNWLIATMGWAGDGLTGLSSSPSGTAHMFLWNSRADNVALAGQEDNIKVRITPSDFHTGNPAESDSFSVDNTITNTPPTVTITGGPEEGSTVYTNQVTFTWSGSDTDGTVIGYYYSFDRDPPNIWTTESSVTSGILSLGEHTFRVIAVDNAYDFSVVESRTFTIGAPPFVKTWGGSNDDSLSAVSVDSAGNIYCAGYTESFGADGDALLLKYDSSGALLWAKTWGGSGLDILNAVAVDSAGNIYCAGATYSFDAAGDALLLKYDSSGTLQWAKTWGGSGWDILNAVAIDSAGNIYCAGQTYSFGAGNWEAFVLKYNTSGTIQWAQTWGGASADSLSAVALDSGGNIYYAGWTYSFGAGYSDALLLKYNSSGTIQWAKTWGGSNIEAVSAVAVDSSGNIYCAGHTYSFGAGYSYPDPFLLKYDTSGALQCAKTWGGSHYDSLSAVAADSAGNTYYAGLTSPFGTGYSDALLLKYDSSGALQWAKAWGGSLGDGLSAVAVDSTGNVYVGGGTRSYTGVWQEVTTGTQTSLTGSESSPTGTTTSPSGAGGSPTGTQTSPTGSEIGAGGSDTLLLKNW
jgi:uncharacterized delta-60 repeat protein